MPEIFVSSEAKKGDPIAVVADAANRITKGPHRKTLTDKILYLDESAKPSGTAFNRAKYAARLRGYTNSQRDEIFRMIERALKVGAEDLPGKVAEPLQHLYRTIKYDAEHEAVVELDESEKFELLPNTSMSPEQRTIMYIAGMSGSGKSYLARNVIENYRRLFPKRKVYLISHLKKESTGTLEECEGGPLDRINPETLVVSPLSIEEVPECLIVLDDWETFEDKKIMDAIYKTIATIVSEGRHTSTSLLVCAHKLTDYSRTRLILSESHIIVVYPKGATPKHIENLLTNYVGVSKKVIQRLRRSGSRWLAFYKKYPVICVGERFAEAINE